MKKDIPPTALLDANLLQLFELIYDTRSVTRAAEQLGLAQPTVSIWLGKLRRQLNDPLFVRTPSGMLPTPEADALIGTVRQALESLRYLVQRETRFDPDLWVVELEVDDVTGFVAVEHADPKA